MTFIFAASSIFPLELRSIDSQDEWSNTIIQLAGGSEQRNVNWSDSLRVFDAATAEHLTLTQLVTIRKHYNAMRGTGFSFPVLDRSFFQITAEPLGTGGGIGSTNQLTVNYGNSSNSFNKEIYLPKSGTLHIYANGVEKTEGADFTVAYSGATGGTVTWLVSVVGQVLTWTGEWYLPCRYAINTFPSAELFIWKTDGTGIARGAAILLKEVRYLSEA